MLTPEHDVRLRRFAKLAMAGGATLALAACAAKPPPPPPPPPPPVVVAPPPPPPRPYPPNSSAPNLLIPSLDAAGRRLTPNVDLTPAQALWQLRIALNVAALNCRGLGYETLIPDYSKFLTNNRREIAAAERTVIADQRKLNGGNGISQRDALSTRLYNYFAQPPVLASFCPTAVRVASAAATEPRANILSFASLRLTEVDQPFVTFYNDYARYQADLADWISRYAPQPATAPVAAGAPVDATLVTMPPTTSAPLAVPAATLPPQQPTTGLPTPPVVTPTVPLPQPQPLPEPLPQPTIQPLPQPQPVPQTTVPVPPGTTTPQAR